MRLSFLAPEIIEAIIAGRVPPSMTGKALMGLHDLPIEWSRQRRVLHIA
ncbi:hypothetical protein GRI89_17520 [Altererythrobacter salegens]|uniref:Uncharacterized protein n=1 Tax=Croceibacterium salegens TaxID=1737568 RepID=A0A6I4T204_9SPHN|nr:hypothetical protein [Croceibacterium salegens]